jgi:hypothetical protein
MLEKYKNRQDTRHLQSVKSEEGVEDGVTYLAELSKVDLESLCIILKAKRNHRVEDILAANRLSLLKLALLRRFGRDEADELGHALLHALLGIFCDFSRRWHGVLHDTRYIRNLFFGGGGGKNAGEIEEDLGEKRRKSGHKYVLWEVGGRERCGVGGTYGQITVLFPVLADFLFCDGHRFCRVRLLLCLLWRAARTVCLGCDIGGE